MKTPFKKTLFLLFGLLLMAFSLVSPVTAQTPSPPVAPVASLYTVQPGDTLALIALRYNLNPATLALTNNLANPNLILPGQQLTLPGVTLPSSDPLSVDPPLYHTVQPGETTALIAKQYGVSVGGLALQNRLITPDLIQVGQMLQIPTGPEPTPEPLTPPFEAVTMSEPTIIQGRTLVIKVRLTEQPSISQPLALSGRFEGRPLRFQTGPDGQWWSPVAIHALTPPDTYPLILTVTYPDGRQRHHIETVTVVEGPYGLENIQLDASRGQLLDAELLAQEQEKLINLWSQISPRAHWTGPFRYPVSTNNLRLTSQFGTRRYYNNSPDLSFHGGTDFGGGTGAPLYAPAAGRVVLAERLIVRGNAVLIDHGLGLYSGYWHQSQLAVTAGQRVEPGDLIGFMGDTGLVTGPHLHWELRLDGIAVDPLQWVQEAIP